jgi:hypothetical protein
MTMLTRKPTHRLGLNELAEAFRMKDDSTNLATLGMIKK